MSNFDTQYFEEIKSLKNMCSIAEVVYQSGREELLATITEVIHQQSQFLIDQYCIVEV